MQINLDNLKMQDGKYVYTFTPDQDMASLDLISTCIGDLEINHLQVEKNLDATYFVPPEVYEGNLKGIFADMRELRMELKDNGNSELWASIRANAKGMLKEYHDGEMKYALAESARSIIKRLEDKESLAKSVMTANYYLNEIAKKDKSVESRITQNAESFDKKITNLNNSTTSRFTQFSDKLTSSVADLKSDTNSKFAQLSNAIDSRVADSKREISSQITQLSNGINSNVNDIRNKSDSRYTQLSNLIAQKVTKSDVEGIIGNSGDRIWLQIKDRVKTTADNSKMNGDEILAEINMTNGLTKIKNKLIQLDGDTVMTNAFAKKMLVEKLQVDDIKAFMGKFSNVIANNMDVNSLTGVNSQFVRTLWNGISSNVSVNGDGLTVRHNDGSYTEVGARGLIHHEGSSTYHTHYLTDVVELRGICHDGGHKAGANPIGIVGQYRWAQLPDIYKGKKFKAVASFSQAETWRSDGYSNGKMTLLRIECKVEQSKIDYENARVPVIGYAHVYEHHKGRRWNFPITCMIHVSY